MKAGAALVPGLTRDRSNLGVWNGPGSRPGQGWRDSGSAKESQPPQPLVPDYAVWM
jgi:hypothetical protein